MFREAGAESPQTRLTAMILPHACLIVPLLLPAQDPSSAPTAQELIHVDFRGIASLFVSEKDDRLKLALGMLDDRLRELAEEAGGGEVPEDMFPVLRRLIEGPMSLRVMLQEQPIDGMPEPLFGELRLEETTSGAAEALVQNSIELLDSMGVEVDETIDGEWNRILASLPLWMGSRGKDYVVRFGHSAELADPLPVKYLPSGVRPVASIRVNYKEALVMSRRFAKASGEQVLLDEFDPLLERFGFGDLAFEYSLGFDDLRSYEVMATEGYGSMMRAMHLQPSGALMPDRVRWIPEDASWAVATRLDISGYIEFMNETIRELPGSQGTDLLEMVHAQTGLDVSTDLLDTLGLHFMVYGSDTTGGGGLTSSVLVMELARPADFSDFMSRIGQMVTDLATEQADGRVQVRKWKEGKFEFTSLQTPGIPIPFEPTMTVIGNAAVFAMTPQGALGAARHIATGQRSLLDQRALLDQLPDDMSSAMSLMYLDSARFMRDGYGMTSLLCSAIANGVRSRDGSRDPGMILPAFADLARGVRPLIGVVRLSGDTLIAEYRGDRSHLVNLTGVLGWFAEVPGPLVGLAVAASVGAAQEQSMGAYYEAPLEVEEYTPAVVTEEEQLAWTEIDKLYSALEVYAASNGGKYPDSLDALAKPDAQGNQYIPSLPRDPWGYPYKYLAPQGADDVPYIWSQGLERDHDESIELDQVEIEDASFTPIEADDEEIVVVELTETQRQSINVSLVTLRIAIEEFAIRNGGAFPTSLVDLITPDKNGLMYLRQATIPKDPWNNEYLYDAPHAGERRFRVYTLGADGTRGGVGANADHDNW